MADKVSIIQRLQACPDSFEFEQLYRLFQQQVYCEGRSIPLFVNALQEPLYRGAELQQVICTRRGWRATCHIPVLGGGLGVAPNYLRELALNQTDSRKELAVRDFFALFDDTFIERTWQVRVKYDLTIQYEMAARKGEQNQLSRRLLSLVGVGRTRYLGSELLVPYIGLLGSKTRNIQSLQQIMTTLFQVKVLLRAAPPRRTVLPEDSLSRLNADVARQADAGIEPEYQNNRLGRGALIGTACWFDAWRLEILLTLRTRKEHERLGDRKLWDALFELVRLYMGQQTPVSVFLLQPRALVPEPVLSARSGKARLGLYQCLVPRNKPRQLVQLRL
ncbi:type VI secretion system baseplate subunit TssG [Endozoicomonadaceae bacterium StTr2]